MDVKFRDVLAGRAGRARKPQHHGIVDRLTVRRRAAVPRRHPRRRDLPASDVSAGPACGPDTRTIAIALGGRPDDRAKWFAPADASPICAGGPEKATPFEFGSLSSRGCGKSPLLRAVCCSMYAAISLRKPDKQLDLAAKTPINKSISDT